METVVNTKPEKQLEVIIEEEEIFSTSRYQPEEPKLEADEEPSCIVKYKTEPN